MLKSGGEGRIYLPTRSEIAFHLISSPQLAETRLEKIPSRIFANSPAFAKATARQV
jgi:hypothetical protein